MQKEWKGDKTFLIAQLVRITEQFINSDIIKINPPLFFQDDIKRRIILAMSMSSIVQHLVHQIRCENTNSLTPVFDKDKPIRSTEDMRPWHTSKPCERTKRSHINFCVYDSTWEASEAFQLDHNENVIAWVKNDHIGFEIPYIYQGIVHKYRPDFLVKLADGSHIIIEVKGQDTEQDKVKRDFLDEWVKAVNQYKSFGKWNWGVVEEPGEIEGVIRQEHYEL